MSASGGTRASEKNLIYVGQDQFQFLGFVDYGEVHNIHLQPGEQLDTYLLGVGPGIRWTLATNLSVRFDYGFQLINTNLGNPNSSQAHLAVNFSF